MKEVMQEIKEKAFSIEKGFV